MTTSEWRALVTIAALFMALFSTAALLLAWGGAW